jgi:hypothetical protein
MPHATVRIEFSDERPRGVTTNHLPLLHDCVSCRAQSSTSSTPTNVYTIYVYVRAI